MVPKCSVNHLFLKKNTKKKKKVLILRRPPINAFYFKIRCILVILDHITDSKTPQKTFSKVTHSIYGLHNILVPFLSKSDKK